MYWLAEPFLYLCFAITSGYMIFLLVPASYRPVNYVSNRVAYLASIGIGVFSFFPILRIVSFFAEDIGWGTTFQQVLFQFTEGRVYLLTLLISVILSFLILVHERVGGTWILQVMWICLMLLMLAQGWASHMASWYGSLGIITQTLHILAVSLWVGPLLLAGWHPRPTDYWSRFLAWYHPMAILSMLVIASSGFVLTIGVAPEYVNAWKLSYGQALLIKHLLLIPLALYAIVNGFWVKKKLKQEKEFQPQIWAKSESLILILIFSVTGFMNQQPAPHKVSNTLNESPASPLYLWFTGGSLDKNSDLFFSMNTSSIIVLIAAVVTFGTSIVYVKRRKAIAAFLWAIISIFVLYYAIMLAVE